MRLITSDELIDKHIGKVGTKERDEFDAQVRAEVEAFRVSQAIKAARKECAMTQTELGNLVGVNKSEISRIENSSNFRLTTLIRVLHALQRKATITIEGVGSISL